MPWDIDIFALQIPSRSLSLSSTLYVNYIQTVVEGKVEKGIHADWPLLSNHHALLFSQLSIVVHQVCCENWIMSHPHDCSNSDHKVILHNSTNYF